MTTVAKDQYNPAQVVLEQEKNQYTLPQILGLWLAAGLPMWVLGWLVYPAMSQGLTVVDAGLLRIKLLTVGLIGEFMLSMLILFREEGNIRIETLRRRYRLNGPVSPKTGQMDRRLWWLLLPLLLLIFVVQSKLGPVLNGLWTALFPFLAEPSGYKMAALFGPDVRALWVGAWDLLTLIVLQSVFNAFGEEFLFRGALLPKMKGVFGRWDWAANAVLFGLYHLHQPWGLPGNILSGALYAFSARHYRTTWFSILLHSGQSIFFIFLILGLVLGLA